MPGQDTLFVDDGIHRSNASCLLGEIVQMWDDCALEGHAHRTTGDSQSSERARQVFRTRCRSRDVDGVDSVVNEQGIENRSAKVTRLSGYREEDTGLVVNELVHSARYASADGRARTEACRTESGVAVPCSGR